MGDLQSPLTVTQLANLDESDTGHVKAYRLFRLEESLFWFPYKGDTARVIIVPKGFISDGPSIPRFLWWFLDVWGVYSRAGFIHDYLCLTISINRPHGEVVKLATVRRGSQWGSESFTNRELREAADQYFRWAMKDCGTGYWERLILYIGVFLGTRMRVKTTMAAHNKRVIDAMATDGV